MSGTVALRLDSVTMLVMGGLLLPFLIPALLIAMAHASWLGCGVSPVAEKALAAKAEALEGMFLRIDEGDYFHWVMATADGGEGSFFILKPDATVDKVVEEPVAYVGRRCRITWKASQETIPEAGGKIDVEQVLSVEWLGKK